MAFEYMTTEQAQAHSGLRMVAVGGVPSPWGESAKGLLHVKGVDFAAVYLDQRDAAQCAWLGGKPGTLTAPVLFWNDAPPVFDAMDVVWLSERIAPQPCLLPAQHANAIENVVNLLAAPGGLGWQRRLQQIHAGAQGEIGFHPKVGAYLGAKYGYDEQTGPAAGPRVAQQLGELAALLGDNEYLFGDALSAADIYLACFVALFAPLDDTNCQMHPATRVAFETLDAPTEAAFDPRLKLHRDRIYHRYLELPLTL